MNASNQEIAKLLRSVAAALTLKKGNLFQIRAYETAADAIEHSTSELKDLWEEDKLDEVPGVGEGLKTYLNELFKIGKVGHFETIMDKFPKIIYELIEIPGIGPKTAYELSKLGTKSLDDLEEGIKSGKLVEKGFSKKIAEKIILALQEAKSRKTGRVLLPYAYAQAERILAYLKKSPDVIEAHPLGSLRRMVATIGDLDFSVASNDSQAVVEYFIKMPGVIRVVDQGVNSATVILASGLQVDLLVGEPESYGALLQHFTGSKHHNIHLRTFAEKKGLSLSEYGVKKAKSGQIVSTKTEVELYKMLGMDTPAPELREDTGEIEAATEHKLPRLVEFKQIKGDLHLHSNFPFPNPSHGPGADAIWEIVESAIKKKYQYVGISDHPPAFRIHIPQKIVQLIEKRTKIIQKLKQSKKSIHVLNSLEVDILGDGTLSVPDEALATLDYCIAGIHSGHRGSREQLTKRILKALANPYVNILAHPTGRLINERDSYDADWQEIFKFAAKNNKLLEINGYPNRLDLRDDLVKEALKYRVKFIIDTDAHEISQMDNMPYGVAVARRGWAEAKDIVNTWDWKKISEWFNIKA